MSPAPIVTSAGAPLLPNPQSVFAVLFARLIVPVVVIGPPVKPVPVFTCVTVPAPGNVCPEANVTIPFFAIDNPVEFTRPGTP